MKRLLTAAVLCAVLILGSVWSIKAVDNTAQAVALDVENDRLNEARETWDAAQTLLGALLLHSEIDQADRLFDRVLAAQQNGLTDEFSLDRAELLAQLRHLPEVQRPTLKKSVLKGNTAQLKLRRFAEILCPDFGFGSLREFRPRCRSFTVIHQVLPQNCASSVRKICSQIALVQLCGIPLTVFTHLHGQTVRIVNVEIARVRLRLADIGRIHAVQDGTLMRAGDILRTEAEEHTGCLDGLALRHTDQLQLGFAVGVLQISNAAAVRGELRVNLELGERLVKMQRFLEIAHAER